MPSSRTLILLALSLALAPARPLSLRQEAAAQEAPAKETSAEPQTPAFYEWAPTPPMGWNSWDCYGAGVNEEQAKANADYMADKLSKYGWQYVVVDIQWYEPKAHGFDYRKDAELVTDENGRLLPADNRFPSTAETHSFKPLADYIHGKGLKFGIHLMRGIPRQCVKQNTPILGTEYRAADIADTKNICPWNGDMYGVDMSKPGAQEYYDSVFQLIASWEVDFVKVDDLGGHTEEVKAVRAAIDHSGRPMVLSVSPAGTKVDDGEFIEANANQWRISDDFWDNWPSLKSQYGRLNAWSKFNAPGHFPDPDMLPLGAIRAFKKNPQKESTHFTRTEQYALMTMWAITRSPLMMGGDMPQNDDFTLSLLTNERVIAVDQHGEKPRQIFRRGDEIGWVADVPDSKAKYLALFNAADKPNGDDADGAPITVSLAEIGLEDASNVIDLWKQEPVGTIRKDFAPTLPYHGAGLYLVTPQPPEP